MTTKIRANCSAAPQDDKKTKLLCSSSTRKTHSVTVESLSHWDEIVKEETSFIQKTWKVICYSLISPELVNDLSNQLGIEKDEIFKHFDRQLHKRL